MSRILMACLLLLLAESSHSFLSPTTNSWLSPNVHGSSPALLFMAKKKGTATGKGFGKAAPEPVKPMVDAAKAIDSGAPAIGSPAVEDGSFLKSVDGGSTAIPQVDESIPVEKRTESILRDQYGLRTREEQQEAFRRQEAAKEQRKKLEEWKKLADQGEDFDIMKILPAPVLIAIDRFLKAGVAVCTVLFILAGVGITIEAYSKTSGNPLPPNIDDFIVNIIEPNFTPGLLVLLGFSVSLGAFAALQLSSASSTYREDR